LLYVEIMCKSITDEGIVNKRIVRTTEAVNLVMQEDPTLGGIVTGFEGDVAPSLSDVFTRRERTNYGPVWFWQGARLEYVVRKDAVLLRSNQGSDFRANTPTASPRRNDFCGFGWNRPELGRRNDPMTYKKWVSQRDQLGDGTTELATETKFCCGRVPVDLSAEDKKNYEEKFGFVFADSSAQEAKEYEESQSGPLQPPGGDVRGHWLRRSPTPETPTSRPTSPSPASPARQEQLEGR
jgi:hypothetical protein